MVEHSPKILASGEKATTTNGILSRHPSYLTFLVKAPIR